METQAGETVVPGSYAQVATAEGEEVTRGVPNSGVRWEVFVDCPKCGAAAGTACFRHNGSRARQACPNRPFEPDHVRDEFARIDGRISLLNAEIEDALRVIRKQQRQIDVLLGEVEA